MVENRIYGQYYVDNFFWLWYAEYVGAAVEAAFWHIMEMGNMAAFAENGYAAGADFIRFGRGERVLVMLPGLGDGLKTVRGTAVPMAWMYRGFSEHFTVYALSRKRTLPQGYSTREMAGDVWRFLTEMKIEKAHILGVSMGGMIAQWLAIDYPQSVEHLVLAVTCPCRNPIIAECIGQWVELAKQGDHLALMESNVRKIYSDAYYQKNKAGLPLVARMTKPKSYDRFLLQAEACLEHDAFAELHRIQAKTLIVGGEKDVCLGGEASKEMAKVIPGARLRMYEQWGHGLYEEAKDFNKTVLDFLLEGEK